MKPKLALPTGAALFVAAVLAAAASGCRSGPVGAPDQQAPPPEFAGTGAGTHASAGSSGAGGMAIASSAGEKAGIGSWFGMCELSRKIANARTPAQRQALIEQVMPDMSQASRERHLQMMQQRCQ